VIGCDIMDLTDGCFPQISEDELNSLLKEERQRLILEALYESKKVTVQDLSRRFGTSKVTIRRDLQDLAATGLLQRAHRGAVVALPAPPEPPIIHRMVLEQSSKESIARAAAELVHDGDAIFIGSGSTTAYLARFLGERSNLTVVTNALNIATDLAANARNITIVMSGGVIRPDELSALGHIAELALAEVRVDKVFMGMQAISLEGGLTTDHLPEVTTTRKILSMAPELIVLADHTKFGRMAAAYIAPVERITTLVTDTATDRSIISQLERLGIKILVVDTNG
jgi:DeoR/GlpR family transcriptional regulator of sugar metabolism